MKYLFWIISGYLSGSILFAEWFPKQFCHIDIRAVSEDGNPGTFNVFQQCGALMGSLVLALELGKGFFPVHAALRVAEPGRLPFALILAAPVLGHAFPMHIHFPRCHDKKGGKAIAVSFGVLLGLHPMIAPVLLLAASYLLFSLVFVIGPHSVRSIIAIGVWAAICCRMPFDASLRLGFCLIALVVIGKHLISEWHHPRQDARFSQ